MTDRDQALLLFVAAHEVVLAEQAAALLTITGEDAEKRLERLRTQKLLSRVTLSIHLPAAYRIAPDGSERVDCALPALRPLNMGRYRHEIATGWLWTAARHGRLGELREVLTRREMQAADATLRTDSLLDTPGTTFETPADPGTDPRFSYPDLALVQATGGWVPLTIVLSPPEPSHLRADIRSRGKDPLIVAQLYLVEENQNTETSIRATAEALGLGDKVHLQTLQRDGIAGV